MFQVDALVDSLRAPLKTDGVMAVWKEGWENKKGSWWHKILRELHPNLQGRGEQWESEYVEYSVQSILENGERGQSVCDVLGWTGVP